MLCGWFGLLFECVLGFRGFGGMLIALLVFFSLSHVFVVGLIVVLLVLFICAFVVCCVFWVGWFVCAWCFGLAGSGCLCALVVALVF